jgi:hypothetical protein
VAPAARPFLALGVVAIVAGGLVAAVSRPFGWEQGPWVAAFLVLVTGIGQAGAGIGQAALADAPVAARRLRAEVLLWNVACGAVIGGTLAGLPAIVTGGGVLLAVALVCFATIPVGGGGARWVQHAYRGLLWVLVISTPVGLVLSWVRAG